MIQRTVFLVVLLVPVSSAALAQNAVQEAARRIDVEARFMFWGDVAEQTSIEEDEQTATDFLIRRARLLVQGRVTDAITVSFQVGQDNIGARLLTPDGGISIKDAYVNVRATNALQVAAGQFKIPFFRSNLESGFNQLLVDRPVLTGLRPAREGVRDVGVIAWGNVERFQYRLALFDGSDQEAGAPPADLRVTSRVAYNFFSPESGFAYTGSSIGTTPVLQLAAQADVQGRRTDPRDDAAFRAVARDYVAYALEGFFEYPLGAWAVTTEAAWLDREDDYVVDGPATRRLQGYYAQGGVLLPPRTGPGRVQVAMRREELNSERAPLETDISRTTIGGTYYFSGHSRKLQADFTVKRETVEIPNDEFRASLVVAF